MFCRRRPDHQDHGFQHSFSNHSPYWCHCHCGLSGFRFSGGRNSTECGRNSGVQTLRLKTYGLVVLRADKAWRVQTGSLGIILHLMQSWLATKELRSRKCGAISTLDAVYLQLQIPGVKIKVITHGMPRAGNQAFADYMHTSLTPAA
ncbi:hypothetical protein RSAG8_05597, partial [Rhizoctonia solani AG-8 WAC10335]